MKLRNRRRKHQTLVWWGKFRKENNRQYQDNYHNQHRWRQVKKAEDERMIRKNKYFEKEINYGIDKI